MPAKVTDGRGLASTTVCTVSGEGLTGLRGELGADVVVMMVAEEEEEAVVIMSGGNEESGGAEMVAAAGIK